MGRRRLIAAITAALAAAMVLSLWLLRDQPRRRVELALSQRLGSTVSISALTFEGLERVRLEGISLAPDAARSSPEVVVDRIVAEGPLREMNTGRFSSLELTGLTARIELCSETRAAQPTPRDGLAAGVLEVRDASIELRCGGRSVQVNANGRMFDVGGETHGRLELSILDPLVPLTDDPRPLSVAADAVLARLELLRGGAVTMTASPTDLRLTGPRELALGDPKLRIEAHPQEHGDWEVTATAAAPHLGDPRVQLTLQRDPWRVASIAGRAEGLDAGAVVWEVPPIPGLRLGLANLQITGSDDSPLLLEASLPELEATLDDVAICGGATLRGDLRSLAPPPEAGMVARLSLAPCDGQRDAGSFARLLPIAATVRAGLTDEPRRLVAELRALGPNSGEISARGWIGLDAAHRFSLDWSWEKLELPQAIERLGIAVPSDLEIAGRVHAVGRLVGDGGATHGRAELDLDDVEIGAAHHNGQPWRVSTVRAHTVIHWTGGRTLRLTLDRAQIAGRTGDSDPVIGHLSAATTLQLDGLDLASTDLDLDVAGLAQLHARADRGVSRWEVHLDSEQLDGWPAAWPALSRLLPAGDTVTGAIAVAGTAQLAPDASSFRGRLTLGDGGYAAADGSRVVAELGGECELDLELDAVGNATIGATARLGGLQLLWGVVYGDYSDRTIGLQGNGRWQPDGRWSATIRADLGETARTDLRIAGTAEAAQWQGTMSAADLGAWWRQWLGVPCAGSLGPLDGVVLDGGSVNLVAAGELAEATTLDAVVQLSGLDIRAGDVFALSGLQLELPVALDWHDGEPLAGAVQRGRLAFASLALGGLNLPATASALSVSGDSITLDSELTIPLLGGQVGLEELGLTHLLGGDRHLETAVELDGLQLSRLSDAFGLPPLDGRLDGHFPLVRVSPDRLSVEGASELQLFGGSIILTDIAGRDPLSRYPRLELAMAWDGIDLGQLTRTFDFGRITGIIEGEMPRCELFQGVPVTCAGWLQSTPRSGIEQRISLKAVNNIAIVGTGSGLGILNRGIHRLIDAYPYESIGFSMDLSNDHFHLRGLSHRGDAELFVKGRLPLRLDVVNARPGTTVSFRSMLARLRQLDFAAVRTEAGQD